MDESDFVEASFELWLLIPRQSCSVHSANIFESFAALLTWVPRGSRVVSPGFRVGCLQRCASCFPWTHQVLAKTNQFQLAVIWPFWSRSRLLASEQSRCGWCQTLRTRDDPAASAWAGSLRIWMQSSSSMYSSKNSCQSSRLLDFAVNPRERWKGNLICWLSTP